MGCSHSKDTDDAVATSTEQNVEGKKGRLDEAEAKDLKQARTSTGISNSTTLHDYCKIVDTNIGTETGLCAGCRDNIGGLLDRWKVKRKVVWTKLSQPVKFHNSFAELEKCCEKCTVCRAIRQALLLRQSSSEDHASLLKMQNLRACLLSLDEGPEGIEHSKGELWIKIFAGEHDTYATTAFLCGSTSKALNINTLSEQRVHSEDLDTQVKAWLRECEETHSKPCGQLNWSTKNPTRLIEIQGPHSLRLVDTANMHKRVRYMALSYVWGGKNDKQTIQAKLSTRQQRLLAEDLYATQQDAIQLAYMVGVHYVWIDAICIVQDSTDDWTKEAGLMHEYYGNACFTLCVLSGVHAAEGFLHYREAWKWPQRSPQLEGVRLMNVDTRLDDARLQSPHALRGWTLQEEFLSPRRLYWYRSSIYWSCAMHTQAEGITSSTRRPAEFVSVDSELMSKFLISRYRYHKQDLHRIWLSIVESYSRRNLTNVKDKAKAISGLAKRCALDDNEYMAGLWYNTFAEELVWKLDVAKSRTGPDQDAVRYTTPPSWSWMSPPIMTILRFQNGFVRAEDFGIRKGNGKPSAGEIDADDRIDRGNLATEVMVKGRMRPLWTTNSRLVAWADVRSNTSVPSARNPLEDISFQDFRGQDAHSVDTATGILAVSERHAEEVVARLDYVDDAILIAQDLLEVHVMEVGQDAMLLLCRTGNLDNSFKRIGACHGYREGLFDGTQVQEICLQ